MAAVLCFRLCQQEVWASLSILFSLLQSIHHLEGARAEDNNGSLCKALEEEEGLATHQAATSRQMCIT